LCDVSCAQRYKTGAGAHLTGRGGDRRCCGPSQIKI